MQWINQLKLFLYFSGSRAPFSARFISDNWEYSGEMSECGRPGKGLKLGYELISC